MSMKDLTRDQKTSMAVGPQLEPIIKNITSYNLQQLKTELNRILCNPETSVSPEKSARYMNDMSKIYSLSRMQEFITNIYFKSANMGITENKGRNGVKIWLKRA